MTGLLVAFLVSTIAAATPLLLAAIGELVVERVGVLNLGVEGMMLAGAIAAFATANETGITSLGVVAALVAGIALALLFAVVSLTLQANQTATGLALIFGGAIGNVYDRVRVGAVTDFLDFYAGSYHWYTFNLADSAICVGAGLLILSMLSSNRKKEADA